MAIMKMIPYSKPIPKKIIHKIGDIFHVFQAVFLFSWGIFRDLEKEIPCENNYSVVKLKMSVCDSNSHDGCGDGYRKSDILCSINYWIPVKQLSSLAMPAPDRPLNLRYSQFPLTGEADYL